MKQDSSRFDRWWASYIGPRQGLDSPEIKNVARDAWDVAHVATLIKPLTNDEKQNLVKTLEKECIS